ncbi:MAG: hypothetical protein IJK28_05985 [Clostridia bacterium]|nr:hypothetical protein [Clostridia bacterium]
MKKRLALAALFLALALLMTACAPAGMFGTWRYTYLGGYQEFTFEPNGIYTYSDSEGKEYSNLYSVHDGHFWVLSEDMGAIKVDGDRLTLTQVSEGLGITHDFVFLRR